MDKRHTLLFGGEAVEEILKRHLGFLICGLGAGQLSQIFSRLTIGILPSGDSVKDSTSL